MASHDSDETLYSLHKLSQLSLDSEGHDADIEPSDDELAPKSITEGAMDEDSDKDISPSYPFGIASMPGTPVNAQLCNKEYASENETRRKRWWWGRRSRGQRRLDEKWENRKIVAREEDGVCGSPVLVVRSGVGGNGRMVMDLDEVRGCRDLGLELPDDWRVEIPGGLSEVAVADTSSGGNSPVASSRISSPGDDPRDMKAKLKMWAQAVALASASASSSPSRLSS